MLVTGILFFIYFISYFFLNYFCFKFINETLEVEFSRRRQILNVFLFHIIFVGFIFILSIPKEIFSNMNEIVRYGILAFLIPLSYYLLIRKETFESFFKSIIIIFIYYTIFSLLWSLAGWFLYNIIYNL